MNAPAQQGASSVENVRVCGSCGHLNPPDDSPRCENCWMPLSGVAAVGPVEAEQLVRSRRMQLLRRRLMVRAVPLAMVLAIIIWILSSFVHIGPNPPGASTNINVPLEPGAWAQARRTYQGTSFTPGQAPVPQTVKWTFDIGGTFSASPAISGDRIYINSDDGRTVALDRETGQPVWEHAGGQQSSSTPAVTGDLVIVTLRPGLTVGLDRATGNRRWETDLKSGVFSSPIVADGAAYIGAADSNLHSLDAATGEELWSFQANDWIITPAAYSDGTVVVAPQDSMVYIVDAGTGRERFKFDTGFQRFGGAPAIQGDSVYFSSDRGWVWALNRTARSYPLQRLLFHVKINLFVWQVISGPPTQPGALWARRVGGEIKTLLAVAHDRVYAATRQGNVFALDAANGDSHWSTDIGATVSAAPIVAGDTVLVGTKSGLVFGLDAETGAIRWEYDAGEEIADSPVVVGGTMYVVTTAGKLSAVTGAE